MLVPVLLSVRAPANNERGPQYIDQAFCAIHQSNPQRSPLSLLLGRKGDTVSLCCEVPDDLSAIVQSQLYAQYPDCKIERIETTVFHPPAICHVWTMELSLHPDLFPIKRYAQFE